MPPKSQASVNMLSADWFNEIMLEVLAEIDDTLEEILFPPTGLLSTGYSPGEMPVGKEAVRRMTPEQFEQILALLEPADQMKMQKMLQEIQAKVEE